MRRYALLLSDISSPDILGHIQLFYSKNFNMNLGTVRGISLHMYMLAMQLHELSENMGF